MYVNLCYMHIVFKPMQLLTELYTMYCAIVLQWLCIHVAILKRNGLERFFVSVMYTHLYVVP